MRKLTRRNALVGACAATALPFPVAAQSQAVAEEGFVRIGGIEQWVVIRGQDRSRPAILFLHGGPCDAQSPHLSLFTPWEARYVVANWDQRGSGNTFTKNGTSTPNVNFGQIAQDAIEVAQYVLARTGQPKLILVGHSWGALLGLAIVRSLPDLFYSFVGTGQPVGAKDIVGRMRSSAIARATAAGDTEAAAKLKSLSGHDLVTDMKNFVGLLVKWTEPFIPSDQRYIATPTAFPNDFCEAALNPTLLTLDARDGGNSLPIPFFIIQGHDDNRTPAKDARAFFDQVHAPTKAYAEIAGGHFACLTNPTAFLNVLDGDLRRIGIR